MINSDPPIYASAEYVSCRPYPVSISIATPILYIALYMRLHYCEVMNL